MTKFSEDIFRILVYLDNEKAKITNKTSEKYAVLCIVSFMVKSFKVYNNEKTLSKVTHLRMFEQLLDDLLMDTTSINFYDGEVMSRSTKRMKIVTENESEYGCRIDLIVKSKEAEEQYDLCSNEFKKTGVPHDILIRQQSKDLRINACIMIDINLLLCNTNTRNRHFDFSGRQSYI
ncbi:unnamed protein product [Rhizopus stolonifer]